MLDLVRGRRALYSLDHRHLPVASRHPPDGGAQNAPFHQVARTAFNGEAAGGTAVFVKMQPIARGASGQSGGKRRRPAFEIGPRPADRIGIDHHPRIAIGDMIAEHRRHDRLIGDAGIGHHDPHRLAGGDEAALEGGHLLGLAERLVMRQVDTARIGDHRHGDTRAICRQPFDKAHPGIAKRFRIRHHMRLADRHHVGGIEHPADLKLMVDGPAAGRPHLAGKHRLFLVAQSHISSTCILIINIQQ